MNTTKLRYPSLTPDDILNLRGEPISKRIGHIRETLGQTEEWVYYRYNDNTKEHYIFKNGTLIGWTKQPVYT